MTAITAVTAQNTKGVKSITPIPIKEISYQIEFTSKDIRPDPVKLECYIPLKLLTQY